MSTETATIQELEILRGILRKEMAELQDNMVHGTLTHEEYKYECGRIGGLALAERELLDLDKRLADE